MAHALVLVAVARFHRPAVISVPERPLPAPEVVYLDFPSSSAPSGAGGGSFAADRADAAPRAPTVASDSARAGEISAPVTAGMPIAEAAAPASARLRAGFRDARLYVDPRALTPTPAPRPVHERLVEDARARILAEPDSIAARKARSLAARQVTVMGRKVTVFGDSAAAGFRNPEIELRPEVQTLSVDGRTWERLELSRQDEAFVRDSLLRARARATRERIDAERRAGRARP